MGVGADARVERRSAQRQEGGSFRGPGTVLSWRRPWTIALSGGAFLFHPDAETGMDDLAARSHGAPRLPDRQAFEQRKAVMVRRIDRPLRERRRAGYRHDRTLHEEQLH